MCNKYLILFRWLFYVKILSILFKLSLVDIILFFYRKLKKYQWILLNRTLNSVSIPNSKNNPENYFIWNIFIINSLYLIILLLDKIDESKNI